MKAKDMKGSDKGSGGVCKQCGVCKCFGWLFPLILLALVLVPTWYGTPWAKWVIVVIAVLMLIKAVKPCKMCAQM